MIKLRIPHRKIDDMFWIDKFESESYCAYHVLFSAEEGGAYLAESFTFSNDDIFLSSRTEPEALDLAILFNDRYNRAVKLWECRRDEVT